MAHQVPWNSRILEEFIQEACLSDLEESIIRSRAAGRTRIQQSQEFNISISTLDKIIKRLKIKYDLVQKYSSILPARSDSNIFDAK